MNHYKYIPIKSNQHICKICRHEFNQIYHSTNEEIEMKTIQPKVDKSIILSSLIKSLKDNIEELQHENDILQKSLQFYRDLSRKSVQTVF